MSALTQREKHLLEQIGENSVLLTLALKLKTVPGWTIYPSVSDHGNDLVLLRNHGKPAKGYKKKLLLEVKARQLLAVSGATNHATFSVTPKERDDCDFLVAFWFEYGAYFVVPKKNLKATYPKTAASSTVKPTGYYFTASFDSSGNWTIYTKKYFDAWQKILCRLK